MLPLTGRTVAFFLLAVLGVVAVILGTLWKASGDRHGQQAAEPFRIAGNFYYVGANDVTAFLITGPEGHVLLDGGNTGMPPLIIASIATLGFNLVHLIMNDAVAS